MCLKAFRILVLRPGIKTGPSAVKVPSPNHWTTREFPIVILIFIKKAICETFLHSKSFPRLPALLSSLFLPLFLFIFFIFSDLPLIRYMTTRKGHGKNKFMELKVSWKPLWPSMECFDFHGSILNQFPSFLHVADSLDLKSDVAQEKKKVHSLSNETQDLLLFTHSRETVVIKVLGKAFHPSLVSSTQWILSSRTDKF